MYEDEILKHVIVNKRIKNKRLTDVSVLVKECNNTAITNGWGVDNVLELKVVWMNDLYEMEIGEDTLYINPETLNEWYIYEPIKQTPQ